MEQPLSRWNEVPTEGRLTGRSSSSWSRRFRRLRCPELPGRLQTLIAHSVIVAVCIIASVVSTGFLDKRVDGIRSGNRLLLNGSYQEALARYEDVMVDFPTDVVSRTNAGLAKYAGSDFAGSSSAFKDVLDRIGADGSIPKAERDIAERVCWYGLGASEYQLGSAAEESSPQDALEHFRRSKDAFAKTVQLNPGDADAARNYAIAYTKVKELEEKLKNQNTQSQQDNQERSGQQQNDQQQNGQGQKQEDLSASQLGQSEQSDQQGFGSQDSQQQSEQTGALSGQPNNDGEDQSPAGSYTADDTSEPTMTRDDALRLLKAMQDAEARSLYHADPQMRGSDSYPDW